ncbi:MAG: twin-arginine translocation signal domain-containing protein [Pseudomonadota bacterium]|nr:twin-arginine translocation signal domain-containing protein [Pseudomonadota bacterium]
MFLNRRTFLKRATAAAAAIGAARLTPAIATPDAPGHADLVRLLIETDRDQLLEALVARIRGGLDYPTLLGAIAEASVRQVRPYPHVGFKYHAFMVLQAVHRTTRHGRPEDRWLPVLWAADVFKGSQAAEQRSGNWELGPVPERLVPAAHKAEDAFRDAMERWDPEAADAAVVGLARSLPRDRLFALLFHYGSRDFRAIGHKAITVDNCHRLMGVVVPAHSESMLRSLVLALLNHRGEPNPADSDLAPDRPWSRNLALATRAKADRESTGRGDNGAVAEILEVLREGSDEDASRAVDTATRRGVPEQQLWTGIFLAAGDLMLKQSGIISVHANTSVNALHYAYRQQDDSRARRLLLLQAAAFLPLFRDLLGGERRHLRIDTLEALDQEADPGSTLEDIFATVSHDRVDAARKTLGYLAAGGAEPFLRLARRYVVERNTGYHDYKFAEAAFENAAAMQSPWRERYIAAEVLYLNGSADKANETVRRARSLLG